MHIPTKKLLTHNLYYKIKLKYKSRKKIKKHKKRIKNKVIIFLKNVTYLSDYFSIFAISKEAESPYGSEAGLDICT